MSTTIDFDAKATLNKIASDPVALAASKAPAFLLAVIQLLASTFSIGMVKDALEHVEQDCSDTEAGKDLGYEEGDASSSSGDEAGDLLELKTVDEYEGKTCGKYQEVSFLGEGAFGAVLKVVVVVVVVAEQTFSKKRH